MKELWWTRLWAQWPSGTGTPAPAQASGASGWAADAAVDSRASIASWVDAGSATSGPAGSGPTATGSPAPAEVSGATAGPTATVQSTGWVAKGGGSCAGDAGDSGWRPSTTATPPAAVAQASSAVGEPADWTPASTGTPTTAVAQASGADDWEPPSAGTVVSNLMDDTSMGVL